MRMRRHDSATAHDTAEDQSSAASSGQDATPTVAARVLSRLIAHSARLQQPAISSYLSRMRNTYPKATPADIVHRLEKHYRATAMAGGTAVGAVAAVPAIGTLIALGAVATETAVFLEATALFALVVAEVHGISIEDRERRRALVLATLVGGDGKRAVSRLLGSGRTMGAWLSQDSVSVPRSALSGLNAQLIRHFVRKYTMRRGMLIFGKLLPAGVGAVIGGVGNRMMAKKIIVNAREAFGDPPDRWPTAPHRIPDQPNDGETHEPISLPDGVSRGLTSTDGTRGSSAAKR